MNHESVDIELLQLRALPITYDLVIGDFGREAATRYVGVLAEEERRFLEGILGQTGVQFFDEYRRIMFTLVGDIGFLKHGMIDRTWDAHSRLTDDVLVAVKAHEVPEDLKLALVELTRDQVRSARRRGHQRVRVVLPCNSMSDVLADVVSQVGAEGAERSVTCPGLESTLDSASGRSRGVSAHGVVRSAVEELSERGLIDGVPFVILGSSAAQLQYREEGAPFGLEVLPVSAFQQMLIDRCVLVCIEGHDRSIADARRALEAEVIKPARDRFGRVRVVEGCTDFNFGLGYDSVRLLAQRMVADAYSDLVTTRLQAEKTH